MASPLDDLVNMPGLAGDVARERLSTPAMPLETPDDTRARVQQTQQRAQVVQRQRGADLAARGIPSYTTPEGTTEAVRGGDGVALTNFDKPHGIAYDSTGNAKALKWGETGAPELVDPMTQARPVVDKAGNAYQVRDGLPWQWTGFDEKQKAVADAAQERKDLALESTTLGRKLTLDEHDVRLGERMQKDLKHKLASVVPGLKNSDGATREQISAAIEDHFNGPDGYGSPDANATTGFFGGDYKPETVQRRAQIEAQKQQVHAWANEHADIGDNLSQLRARAAESRQAVHDVNGRRVTSLPGGAALPPQQPAVQPPALPGQPTQTGPASDAEAVSMAKAKSDGKPFFGVQDAISGIWDMVQSLGTGAPAAFYQLVEGLDRPDKYSPSAKAAFDAATKHAEAMNQKTLARQLSGESTSTGETLRELGGSLAFSGASMVATAAGEAIGKPLGAAVGALAGPVGASVGGAIGGKGLGMMASGAAAYRMAGASFLDDAFRAMDAKSLEKIGRPMNEDEKAAAFEKLLPIAQNTGLWEAGPEAVSNAVTMGMGKITFGIGNSTAEHLAVKALGKVGAKVAAVAVEAGTELATETLTQVEQDADQKKADAIANGGDPNAIKADWTPSGVGTALKEVAPQTLAMSAVFGGVGGAVKLAHTAAQKRNAAARDAVVNPSQEPASPTEPPPLPVSEVPEEVDLEENDDQGAPAVEAGAPQAADTSEEAANVAESEETNAQEATEPVQEPAETLQNATNEAPEVSAEPTVEPTEETSVDAAAHDAASSPKNELPEPTEAQKQAGNYKLGHDVVAGIPISFENPAGSVRKGTDSKGKAWETPMKSHYGYVKGTVGADTDHVDIFVKQGTPRDYSGPVFVVNQHNEDGNFDEHKAVLGVATEEEARAEYQQNYHAGWTGGKTIARFDTPADFKAWAESPAARKPAKVSKAASLPTQDPAPVAPAKAEAAGAPLPPMRGTPEFDAMPVHARAAAIEWHINEGILATGKHPDGSKITPAQRKSLEDRRPQALENFRRGLNNEPEPSPPSDKKKTQKSATESAADPDAISNAVMSLKSSGKSDFKDALYRKLTDAGRSVQVSEIYTGALGEPFQDNQSGLSYINRALRVTIDGKSYLVPKIGKSGDFSHLAGFDSTVSNAEKMRAFVPAEIERSGDKWRIVKRGSITGEAANPAAKTTAADPSAITTESARDTVDGVLKDMAESLPRMGVQGVDFGGTSNRSGIQFAAGRIKINEAKLAKSMEAVRDQQKNESIPGTPEDWVKAVIWHEAIHAAQEGAANDAGKSIADFYNGIDDKEFSDEMMEFAAEAYGPEWKRLKSWQRKAEAVRMIAEGRYNGTITEALYKVLKGIIDFMRKTAGEFKSAGPFLREHIADLEKRMRQAKEPSAKAEASKVEAAPAPEPAAPKPAKAPKAKVEKAPAAKVEPKESAPSATEEKPAPMSKRAAAAAALKAKLNGGELGAADPGATPQKSAISDKETRLAAMEYADALMEDGITDPAEFAREVMEAMGWKSPRSVSALWNLARLSGADIQEVTEAQWSGFMAPKSENVSDLPPATPERHAYGMRSRPLSIGAQPKGHIDVDESDKRARYGVVYYDHALSDQEVSDFELIPLTAKENADDTLSKSDNPTDETDPDTVPERAGNSTPGDTQSPGGKTEPGNVQPGGRVGGEQPNAPQTVGSGRDADGEGNDGKKSANSSGADGHGSPRGKSTTPKQLGDRPDVRGAGKPAATVAPGNFVITDAEKIGEGSLAEKFADNIKAIETLKAIEVEGRPATAEEQSILARYVGWGGIKNAFVPENPDWTAKHDRLKALLTEEEHDQARASIQDSHYTSPTIIKGIYDALRRFGFRGGKMIEGGAGIGHFLGLLPADMRAATSYMGVERDGITARIAALLYPRARFIHNEFQKVDIERGHFDASAGNPPFGQQKLFDAKFKEASKFSIHNFFIAKQVEALRPGGVGAWVVSHYFMDALDPAARQFIDSHAEFLGAVRLPNTAFKKNANTEVTTDIVFFRKRFEGETGGDKSWITSAKQDIGGQPGSINQWLHEHPEMMLGTPSMAGTMHPGQFEFTLKENKVGGTLEEQLGKAIESLPSDVYQNDLRATTERLADKASEAPADVKVGSFFVRDGQIHRRGRDINNERTSTAAEGLAPATVERIKKLVQLRDTLNALVRAESSDQPTKVLNALRKSMNKHYDAFVAKHGPLNTLTNRRAFADDTDAYRVLALERDFDPGVSKSVAKSKNLTSREPSATKAAIFTSRLNVGYQEVTSTKTPEDALIVSLNQRGTVDPEYMGKLTGKDASDVVAALGPLIYQTPAGEWQQANHYLSGNVREKLAQAVAAVKAGNKDMERNVEALEKAMPPDVKAADIYVPIGAGWVGENTVGDFIREITGKTPELVAYSPAIAKWNVTHRTEGTAETQMWGIPEMHFGEIIDALLNNKAIIVTARDSEGRTYTLEEETAAAQTKGDEIKAKWSDWIMAEPERRERLAKIYNETVNNFVEPKSDGSHLTLPGKSATINLYAHQMNGVARIITQRTVLLDQVVGAGKTFEIVAGVMEMKRLGVARKHLVAVPNHLTTQWRDAFVQLYPNANVLFATPDDFKAQRRQKLFAKMMTGEYDAVIVGHSSLKKIGMPAGAEAEILGEMLQEVTDAIRDMRKAERSTAGKKTDSRFVAGMEKTKDSIKAKLEAAAARVTNRDQVVTFDELGFDGITIDEAHEFKNLFYTTGMQNVAGMGDPKGSGKAFDLFVKMRWLQKRYNGKAPVIFATGTPVSNSLVEMFTMQRFLIPDVLKKMNLTTLDAWAKVFGDVKQVYEVDPSGTGYRLSTRFANFLNVGDLAALYRTFADVITLDDLHAQAKERGEGRFPVPEIEGGKPENLVVERSDAQADYFGHEIPQLDEKGEEIEDSDGNPVVSYTKGSILDRIENMPSDRKIDNMLNVTTDARRSSLDMRLIHPEAPDNPNSKVNEAVRGIVADYHKWTAKKGTQLVFCDLSVPSSARGKATAKAKEQAAETYIIATPNGQDTPSYAIAADAKPLTLAAMPDLQFFTVKSKATGKYRVVERSSGWGVTSGKTLKAAIESAESTLSNEETKDRVRKLIEEKAIPLETIAQLRSEQESAEKADVDTGEESEDDTAADKPEKTISLDELLADQSKFSVYDDMRDKLIAAGIPAEQFAFIHDYDTPEKKQKLFDAVNRGDVRVLMGSTAKMGAGMNVQKRAVGIWHLDVPWKPSDIEQRNGRIIRQGNMFFKEDPDGFRVRVVYLATKQTYDTRMWQINEHKANGISQFRKADRNVREMEDVDATAASAADMKAAASGDPRIQREIELRGQVRKLDLLRRSHLSNQEELVKQSRWLKGAQSRFDAQTSQWQAVETFSKANPKPEKFSVLDSTHRDGKYRVEITDKSELLPMLKSALETAGLSGTRNAMLMEYRGLMVSVHIRNSDDIRLTTTVNQEGAYKGGYEISAYTAGEDISASGIIQRIDNFLDDRPASRIERAQTELNSENRKLSEIEPLIGSQYAKQGELEEKRAEHASVLADLKSNRKSKATKTEPLGAASPDDDTDPDPNSPKGKRRRSLELIQSKRDLRPAERAELDSLRGGSRNELGAAAPEESEAPPLNLNGETSTKRATMRAERRARGAEELATLAKADRSRLVQEAITTLDENPDAGRNLAERLVSSSAAARSISSRDEALLLVYKSMLQSQREDAADTLRSDDATPEAMEAAQEDWDRLESDLNTVDNASNASGSAWSGWGHFRKQQLKSDFSFAVLETRARKANGGEALTREQSADLQAQADALARDIDAAYKRRTELEAQERTEAIEQAVQAALDNAPVTRAGRYTVGVISRLETAADSALERIRAKLAKRDASLNAASPSEEEVISLGLEDEAIYGAAKIPKEGMTKAKWLAEMKTDLGDYIQAHAEAIWAESSRLADAAAEKEAAQTVKTAKAAAVEAMQEEGNSEAAPVGNLGRHLKKLALELIEGGVRTRDTLVDALHEAAGKVVPGIDREAVEDLFSDYGKFKPATQDSIKIIAAQLRSEVQMVRKIQDMENGQAAKLTGAGRVEPSTEARRLSKIVEDLKRRGGFNVVDPVRALRTTLDAIKTRLRNEISDMDAAIAQNTPMPGQKTAVKYDAAAQKLKARRDAKKAEYAAQFPKDTKKAKLGAIYRGLERSITTLEAQLKANNLYPGDATAEKLTSPQIDAMRARLDALRDEREILRRFDSDRVEAQKAKTLQARIAELKDQQAKGWPDTTVRTPTVETAEITALQAERDALVKARAKDLKGPAKDKETARIEALDKMIAAKRAKVAAGDSSTKAKSQDVKTKEVTERENELKALNAQMAALRSNDETRRTGLLLASKSRQLAANLERIERGDFAPKAKTAPRVTTDAGLLALEAKIQASKREIGQGIADYARAHRTATKRAMDLVADTFHTMRALMTGGEFSGVLRQGKLAVLSHPVLTAKGALPDMFKAFRSEANEGAQMAAIWNRDNAALYKSAKLAIHDPSEFNAAQLEGNYRSRWANKIPFIAGSGRAYTMFLNRLRADVFDVLVEKLQTRSGNITPEQAKVIAGYVNEMTGSGSLGRRGQQAAELLNVTFFAPKYVMSRFQMISLHSLWKGDAHTRRLVVEEYAKILVGMTAMYGLAALALSAGGGPDDPIESDPRSSDFGKIKIGPTRIDPMAGILQATVFLSRMASGQIKDSHGKIQQIRDTAKAKVPFGKPNAFDVMKNFGRSKMGPIPGAVIDRLNGKDFMGQPVTLGGQIANLSFPMTYGDIYQAMKAQGVPKGTALSILAMFGESVNTYSPKPKEQPKAAASTMFRGF